MSGTPQAFLSYTRLDDQGHEGGITALRAALELQVRIVTGDDSFEIFQDVDGIAFGEHWPKKLDQALAAARFLIPVLSPRFFRSEPCRDELRKFLAHERAAGRVDLILPVYLVRAPVLELAHLTAADELAVELAQRQRWDWRPHAFASLSDHSVRRAVRELAEVIGERLDREAQPNPSAKLKLNDLLPPAPLPIVTARLPRQVFRDVDEPWCPEMVEIPTGSFTMGSPKTEEGRLYSEGPQRRVRLGRRFALGRHAVTRGQFAAFVAATGHDMSGGANVWTGDKWELKAERGWQNPGLAQTDHHPVVCVSWQDARAYVRWLAHQTGQPYRLPTEAEWEYSARGGTATPFWTGATISTAQANYDGNYIYGAGAKGIYRRGTVAVDDPSFPANSFGLSHMHGNVWEWVQDCYVDSYSGAPKDGHVSPDRDNCPERVLRGGSWYDFPRYLRSANRGRNAPVVRVFNLGFRVARMLTL